MLCYKVTRTSLDLNAIHSRPHALKDVMLMF